jgi:hypothetical protein
MMSAFVSGEKEEEERAASKIDESIPRKESEFQ